MQKYEIPSLLRAYGTSRWLKVTYKENGGKEKSEVGKFIFKEELEKGWVMFALPGGITVLNSLTISQIKLNKKIFKFH